MKRLILAMIVLLAGYAAWHFYWLHGPFGALHSRSAALQNDLNNLLVSGQPAALFPLTDKVSSDAAVLCIVGPYSDARRFLSPNGSLGLDESWLSYVDERTIGIVTLIKSGKVSQTFSLDRMKLDIRPYGWPSGCFERSENPRFIFSSFDSETRMLVTLQSDSGALN